LKELNSIGAEEISNRLSQAANNIAVHAVSNLNSMDNVTVLIVLLSGGPAAIPPGIRNKSSGVVPHSTSLSGSAGSSSGGAGGKSAASEDKKQSYKEESDFGSGDEDAEGFHTTATATTTASQPRTQPRMSTASHVSQQHTDGTYVFSYEFTFYSLFVCCLIYQKALFSFANLRCFSLHTACIDILDTVIFRRHTDHTAGAGAGAGTDAAVTSSTFGASNTYTSSVSNINSSGSVGYSAASYGNSHSNSSSNANQVGAKGAKKPMSIDDDDDLMDFLNDDSNF
jgi:hypothetical protein